MSQAFCGSFVTAVTLGREFNYSDNYFFVFWVIELYNNRPGKESKLKSDKVLKDFLDNIGDVTKLNFVERELNKYSIRQLGYLYDGLDREIYQFIICKEVIF